MIVTVCVVMPPVASVVVMSKLVVPAASKLASLTVIAPVVAFKEVPPGRLPEASTALVIAPSVSATVASTSLSE